MAKEPVSSDEDFQSEEPVKKKIKYPDIMIDDDDDSDIEIEGEVKGNPSPAQGWICKF